ncbi:MAG: endolytic transglycosylase MltG, partial [Actinobacteria bacterium]|nr:endolytic transglycosylase MltG [Actinomycetota bacterium]
DPLLRPPRVERDVVDDWREDPWDDPRRLNDAGGASTDIAEPVSLERFRDVLRLVSVVVVALTLLFGAVGWWYLRQVNPSGEAAATATFTINQGDTLSEVSQAIVANFRPDGVSSLEGLLFPDTYLVSGDETPTQVIQRMVTLMEDVAREEGLSDAQSKVGYSPYKVLIVASMIEREAKIDEDRAKIARVIYNRLEAGMPLQIDATLYYGAPEGASFADLKAVEGPYNTYLKKGLPPTPIASPGRASIRAALNPANNPSSSDPLCAQTPKPCRYLYYVLADADGRHAFAATLAQHEANVEAARAAGLLP